MSFIRFITAGIISFVASSAPAMAGVWSIYWQSDVVSCAGAGGPIVNSTYLFEVGGSPVSIMPNPMIYPNYPYDQGRPITVTGWILTQVLSDATASGTLLIGAGNAAVDGPDVFGMTSGVGNNTHSGTIPGGGFPMKPSDTYPGGYSHFDLYGTCDKGTMKAIAVIFYTSP